MIPGLLFGLIVGGALYHGRYFRELAYLLYVAAATLACWAATMTTMHLLSDSDGPFGERALAGIAGGLVGAGLLTAVTVVPIPSIRHVVPCASMIAIGGALGSLVVVIFASPGFGSLVVFYAAWQSAYAASLGALLQPVSKP